MTALVSVVAIVCAINAIACGSLAAFLVIAPIRVSRGDVIMSATLTVIAAIWALAAVRIWPW